MNQRFKKVLLRESLIMLALLGGGSLIVIIDCLRSRYPVINTGGASLHYFPTISGEIGIIIFFLCPLYLLIRFIIWGIRKGLKRCALFCLAALLCLFSAGCCYVKREVILTSEAVSIKGLPKIYEGYTITAVPGCNDYHFRKPAEKDSSAESGYARAVLLKDNIYIVQIKYDNYPDYIIMLLKFTNDASGKSLNMVFSDTNIEPSQYGVSLKVNGFYGTTLIGSRKNIMAFLRAYAKVNLTDQPPALYKMKDKILIQAQREGTKEKLIELTKEDLAKQLAVSKDKITVKSAEKIIWPNSALGYPQEGRYYLQVLTDGYKIILGCNGKDYEYHTNMSNVFANESAKELADKGLKYAQEEKYDQAIIELNKAIKLDPQDGDAYGTRGLVYDCLGNHEQAMLDFNKSIELNPKNADNYFARGNAHFLAGHYDQAIADCSKAIEINPALELAYFTRGNAYNFSGKYDQAIVDFTQCIELNPDDVRFYNNRGTAYGGKGVNDLAFADYEKAIKINPGYAPTYRNRGGIYYQARKFDQAISDYDMAIKLDPAFADAYNDRGTAYSQKGNDDLAIIDYTKAIELDPQYAIAYSNRAEAYYLKREYDLAWADVHKAKKLEYKVDSQFLENLKKSSGKKN